MSQSDLDLLNRFYQDGDADAIEEFINRNREIAWRYARTFTDSDFAEDIVQIAIVRLMNAKPANGLVLNAKAWLRSIVYSVAVDQIRSESTRAEKEADSMIELNLLQRHMDLESNIMRTQLIGVLRDEIGKLAPHFRETLIQRYFKGLSYKEIARTLNLKTSTVSTRLARGLHQLTLALSRKGLIELSGPSHPNRHHQEGMNMTKLSHETIEANRHLAERWHNLWTVSNQGLGRFTSNVNEEGTTSITWREDCPVGRSRRYRPEFPDQAEERRWTEHTIHVTDAATLDWSSLVVESGRIVDRSENSREKYEIIPSSGTLRVSLNDQKHGAVQLNGTGPIMTNPLLPILVREFGQGSTTQWPARLLGLLPQESRDAAGSDWAIVPVFGRYAGQIGKPMSRGHLYEFGSESAVHMEITILTSSEGDLTGCFWAEEGYAVVADEEAARAAYLAIQS